MSENDPEQSSSARQYRGFAGLRQSVAAKQETLAAIMIDGLKFTVFKPT